MTTETIATLHPNPDKTNKVIDKAKYETIKAAILEVIAARPGISFDGLLRAMDQKLAGSFDGAVGWYTVTVKLDLEARGLIAHEGSPQRLYLA